MFGLHNAALWPLHVLTLAAGVIIILLIARRPAIGPRWLALILAILWIFVGWSFLWNRYATINWAAAYVAPAFAVEGVLLLVIGSLRDGLASTGAGLPAGPDISSLPSPSPARPLLGPLPGRGWASSEVFGITPDPTAMATLGVLLLAHGRLLPVLYQSHCIVPSEQHEPRRDGRAASLGPLCRPGAGRGSLDLDDYPPAEYADVIKEQT